MFGDHCPPRTAHSPDRVITGQRAGMAHRHAFAQRRARGLDRDYGHTALTRLLGSGTEPFGVAHGFQEQANGAR